MKPGKNTPCNREGSRHSTGSSCKRLCLRWLMRTRKFEELQHSPVPALSSLSRETPFRNSGNGGKGF